MIVFIIPARKGSKRLQDKNVFPLFGKPLIEYTFDAVSKFKDQIKTYVTTDDERIMGMAEGRGYEVIKRPPKLADDRTTMLEVLEHAVSVIPGGSDLCVLYPTNPLRTSYHILEAFDVWRIPQHADATLMSVSPVKYRPHGLMERQENGCLKCVHPYGEFFYQDQKQPTLYRANGAIYIIPSHIILSQGVNSQLFNKRTIPYVMDDISGFEIDVPSDIPVAEALMRFREPAKELVAVNA